MPSPLDHAYQLSYRDFNMQPKQLIEHLEEAALSYKFNMKKEMNCYKYL